MGAARRLTTGFVECTAAVAVVGAAVDLGVAAGDASLVDRAEEAVGGHGRIGSDHHEREMFEEMRGRERPGLGVGSGIYRRQKWGLGNGYRNKWRGCFLCPAIKRPKFSYPPKKNKLN